MVVVFLIFGLLMVVTGTTILKFSKSQKKNNAKTTTKTFLLFLKLSLFLSRMSNYTRLNIPQACSNDQAHTSANLQLTTHKLLNPQTV